MAAAASGRLGKRDFGRKARLVLRRAPVWAVLRPRCRRGRAMSSPPTTPLVSIYDGRECLGHVLARGKAGYEAFDRDDKPVGIFETQRQAANALALVEALENLPVDEDGLASAPAKFLCCRRASKTDGAVP